MANITTQTIFDNLQSSTAAIYTDTSNTDIQTDITMDEGNILTTTGLVSSTATDFTADNCIINLVSTANGTDEWTRGHFSAISSTLIFTHASGNSQWPGFSVAEQTDRPTYDLTGATIINRNTTASQLTNHYGNMALTGNSFDGLTFSNGAFYYPLGAVPLLRVTFSPDSADDASTPVGVDTYIRSQKATGGLNPGLTATYSGFFECDLTGMTSTTDNILSFNIRPADYAPTNTQIAVETNKAVAWFLIENDYSAQTLSDGLRFVSGNGRNDGVQSFQSVTGYLITGIPWAPEWRDGGVFTAVTDIVTNLGNRTVWIASSDGDNAANVPTSIDATSGSNYVGNYVGATKRAGYLLETATAISRSLITDSQRGQQTIAVQVKGTTIASLPWWSYTHQCYTAGVVRTRTTTAPTQIGEFQYDQTILDVIDIASEGALLNSKTLAAATVLVSSGSLSTLDDLYSVMKSLAYNNREETIFYRVVGSKLSMLTNNWQLYSGATTLSSFRTLVGCASSLSGGLLFDGLNGNEFSAFTAKTLSNMSLQFSVFNMNNVTLGAGITLDGGSFTNTQITMSDLTFINQPVFQLANGQTYTFNDDVGGFTLNLASGAATVNITGSTLTPTLTGSGTITIPVVTTTTTFVVGADKPSGRVILKLRGSAVGTNVMDTTHTSGVKTTLATFTNDTTSSDIYDIYYQPTNTFGANGEFFITSKISSSISGTIDKEVDITAAQHADVLTTSAENADLTGLTATMSNPGTGTTSNIAIGGTDTTTANAPQSQAILLRVVDDVHYLNLMANVESDADFLLPLIRSGTSVNQKHFTLTSSDGEQQGVTAVSGIDTGTLVGTITTGGSPATIRAVNITPNSAGISVPEVESAIRPLTDSIETKVDSTKTVVDSTENRVADIADKDETLPGPFRKDAYNPDTDYKT